MQSGTLRSLGCFSTPAEAAAVYARYCEGAVDDRQTARNHAAAALLHMQPNELTMSVAPTSQIQAPPALEQVVPPAVLTQLDEQVMPSQLLNSDSEASGPGLKPVCLTALGTNEAVTAP
eukprot:6205825-Pleurochrysis_carterae.AAC.2